MAYQIFISYRRVGGDALAFLLKERLQQAGYRVFFDVESLHGGKFNEELLKVIDECDNILLILSPGSLDRCGDPNDWVFTEVAYAMKKQKNIIPIMTNGFEWPKNMPENIRELQYYNGAIVNYDFFDGFMKKVHSLINTETCNTIEQVKDKKHILLWGDFGANILNRIVKRLGMPDEYYMEILTEPIELLSKNLALIDSIVLIDTDVTKLASTDFALERINQALEKYVLDGGKLIATHDIIYRRTRNETLQKMFGCCISHFQQAKEVQYNKTEACKEYEIFGELPEQFSLIDDELCWGELAPDVNVFFENEDGIPLVFSREYGKGLCVWMNSGDFKKYPSESILKPDANFIALLKSMILWEDNL